MRSMRKRVANNAFLTYDATQITLMVILIVDLLQVLRENYSLRLNVTVGDILFNGINAHCPPNASLPVKAVCSIVEHFPGLRALEKMPNGDLNVGVLRFVSLNDLK